MKPYYLFLALSFCFTASSQEFFVNTYEYPDINKLWSVNAESGDMTYISSCEITNISGGGWEYHIGDMAVDINQNIYFVSLAGSLYKSASGGTENFEYLGSFPLAIINALVTDADRMIYACGLTNGVYTLFSYNIETGEFATIGNLPENFISAGDLFFYKKSLFITCNGPGYTSTFLGEINMVDPQQSCYHMDMDLIPGFGIAVVTIDDSETVYMITSENEGSVNRIREIDMDAQTISEPLHEYTFDINGAAAFYNKTSLSSTCSGPTAGISGTIKNQYLNIINPVQGAIKVSTNISTDEFLSIGLFDMAGRKINDFATIALLDVSVISAGTYVITFTQKSGSVLNRKIIIN